MSQAPLIIQTKRVVPNQFPVIDPGTQRLAIIGEAPNEDELNYQRPFVGAHGNLLDGLLRDLGHDRKKCFLGNVCQQKPRNNDINQFDWNGEEVREGLAALRTDLTTYSPHICLLLGDAALHAFRPNSDVSDWRGSLFMAERDRALLPIKSIASYHPTGVLRDFSQFPLFKFDLSRAIRESSSPDLVLPQRELITNWSVEEVIHYLDSWPSGQRCSLDIEGGLGGWPCVSLANSALKSVTIAFSRYNDFDHARILQSFARLMWRRDVPKVLQNSLYDNFVLSYGFGILIRNVREDTMLKGWEKYCELPKGLATQASIWTRQPQWKDMLFYTDKEKKAFIAKGGTFDQIAESRYRGCAIDSAVTLEICEAQDSALDTKSKQHYYTNVSMLNPLLYMELRGIRYDTVAVQNALAQRRNELSQLGEVLNKHAGCELRGAKGSLSSKRLATALYEKLQYPPQFKKEGGRKSEKLTTDVEAILNLRKKLPQDNFLGQILQHRHLEGLIETLSIQPDADGRVRCGYNVVGTETGRLTCYTSPTGAGANLQTITKKLRVNYCADPDHDFFQCDLAGADGWTVAAHCLKLGDRTMFDDYIAGLKPAKIVSGLYAFGPVFNGLDRESLVYWGRKVPFGCISTAVGTGIYDCSKVVQHGSNYGMGIPTMQMNVMKKSFKETGTPIYMEHRDAAALQNYYFLRYPGIRIWHKWAEATLRNVGSLTSSSGHTRVFFGRRFGTNIQDTLKEFLADEPQQNTTWATNLAMLRLWNDPSNRLDRIERNTTTSHPRHTLVMADGSHHEVPLGTPLPLRLQTRGALLIEPLHQVHDALIGQFPSFVRPWAKTKIISWFQNPLTIAGVELIIPFEMGIGPNWLELKNEDVKY